MIESGIIGLEKDRYKVQNRPESPKNPLSFSPKRDRINRVLVDDICETLSIIDEFPRVKFLLDKDLVTEELIREIDRETEWEMVEMIETNKKGTYTQGGSKVA